LKYLKKKKTIEALQDVRTDNSFMHRTPYESLESDSKFFNVKGKNSVKRQVVIQEKNL
jgi:hypothetical protein